MPPSALRKPYPSDVSDEDWSLVAPYLTLMKETAPQREYPMREMFNALRYVIRYGIAWRSQDLMLPVAIRVPLHKAHSIERRAHRMLVRSYVKNEWFDAAPDQASFAVLQVARLSALCPLEAAKPICEDAQPFLQSLELGS